MGFITHIFQMRKPSWDFPHLERGCAGICPMSIGFRSRGYLVTFSQLECLQLQGEGWGQEEVISSWYVFSLPLFYFFFISVTLVSSHNIYCIYVSGTSRFIRKSIGVLRVILDRFLQFCRSRFLYSIYGDNNRNSTFLTRKPWASSMKGLCNT